MVKIENENVELEKDLQMLLTEWNKNDGVVICNYCEAQALMEFLINVESPFKVTFPDEQYIRIQRYEEE